MKGLLPALLLVLLGALPAPAAAQLTGILVPVFEGPQPLAGNVATTLNLQIWRTLRRAPWPNPRRLDFGSGIVMYATDVYAPRDAADTAMVLDANGIQLLLWGQVAEVGGDALVQAFLAAPPAQAGTRALWTVTRGGRSAALGLPRPLFDFAPVILARDVVERYRAPDALRMCATKALPCTAMPVGSDWKALKHEGAWAQIKATDSGRTGWLHLPSLDRIPNDISDFAAALLSYYRGDFGQAARLFQRVADRPDNQATTRDDAAALAAIARLRDGNAAGGRLPALAAANPDSLYLFQAAVMAELAGPTPDLAGLRRQVDANRDLFDPGDAWLAAVAAMVAP